MGRCWGARAGAGRQACTGRRCATLTRLTLTRRGQGGDAPPSYGEPGGPCTLARQWNRLLGCSGAALKPGGGAPAPGVTPGPAAAAAVAAAAAAAAIASNSSSSLHSRRLAILAVGTVGTTGTVGGSLDPAAAAAAGTSLAAEHSRPVSVAAVGRCGGGSAREPCDRPPTPAARRSSAAGTSEPQSVQSQPPPKLKIAPRVLRGHPLTRRADLGMRAGVKGADRGRNGCAAA